MPYTIAQLSNLVTEGEFGRLATQLPEDDEERLQVLRDIEAELPEEDSILKTAYLRDPNLLPVALSLYPDSARLAAISGRFTSLAPGVWSPKGPWLSLLANAYPTFPHPHEGLDNALNVIQAVLSSLPEDARVTALTSFGLASPCALDSASQHAALWEACVSTLPTATLLTAVREQGTQGANLLHRIANRGDHSAMSRVLQTLPEDERCKLLLSPSSNQETTIRKALAQPKVLISIFETLPVKDRLFILGEYVRYGISIPETLFAAITAGLSRDDTLDLLTTPILHYYRKNSRPNSLCYTPPCAPTLLYESAQSHDTLRAFLLSLKCQPIAEEEQEQTDSSKMSDCLALLYDHAAQGLDPRLFSILPAANSILLNSPQTADKLTFVKICCSAIDTAKSMLEDEYPEVTLDKMKLLDALATEIRSQAQVAGVLRGLSVFDETAGKGPEAHQPGAALEAKSSL